MDRRRMRRLGLSRCIRPDEPVAGQIFGLGRAASTGPISAMRVGGDPDDLRSRGDGCTAQRTAAVELCQLPSCKRVDDLAVDDHTAIVSGLGALPFGLDNHSCGG